MLTQNASRIKTKSTKKVPAEEPIAERLLISSTVCPKKCIHNSDVSNI